MVSLNDVLDTVEPLLRRTLGEDIELVVETDPRLKNAEADVHQFEQVITNLALNARDAMPTGGRLSLATSNFRMNKEFCRTHLGAVPGLYVLLSVTDTGVGMDETTRDRIFEPFFTTKAAGMGTGLGLAVVYGIVIQSRGHIYALSEPGRGTTIEIYLPRVAAPASKKIAAVPERTRPGGPETILVVEDEPALQSLVVRVLSGVGYRVLAAGDAAEALKILGESDQPPDLLLTDVVLPGERQGNDLAREFATALPGLPVLFMSGYPRETIVHAGRLDEGVSLLEKPFTADGLAAKVREALDQARSSG